MAIGCKYLVCLYLGFLLSSVVPAWAVDGEIDDGGSLDFIYVNANAGEAAGGHTALRLGDSVFHFQFFPDETFLLVRESWQGFRFLYNDLHNRTISLASLPLAPPVYRKIRNNFNEIRMIQQQVFYDLEILEKERQFVQQVEKGVAGASIDGLGFFVETEGLGSLNNLQKELEQVVGQEYFGRALEEAGHDLQLFSDSMIPSTRAGEHLGELLGRREFLRLLLAGAHLNPQTVIHPMVNERALDEREISGLQVFRVCLMRSILKLLQSSRPDSGKSLLLQAARYLVVQYSLATGRLHSLDPFPDTVRTVQLSDEEMAGGHVARLQENLMRQSEKQRELFFLEPRHPEIAYSFLETGRARAWELSRVDKSRRTVRILTGVTLPSRPGVVTEAVAERKNHMLTTKEALEEEIRQLQNRIAQRFGYNLITRNCATELLRSLNSSFSDAISGKAELGGWLEADSGLVFIPFLFYQESVTAFSLQNEQILTARRLRNLQTLYEDEGDDFLIWLRESNTLTSTLYEPRSKDTPFLFFTDDSFFLRPLQGLCNMGYAALHGVAGVFTLPFDHGDRIQQAARGIFYSLPEVGFGNIRKGSYSNGVSEKLY